MSTTREKVDDIITAIPGQWQFDEKVAESFDDHVRKSVPFYDDVQSMVAEISEFFVRDGSIIYDLGSSTGETIRVLAEKHKTKNNVDFFGIEMSPKMVEESKRKLKGLPSVKIIQEDLREIGGTHSADLVVCLYTLQFLNLEERYKLLSKVYASMNAGGVFIFVEKVHSDSPHFSPLWNELHWDFKKSTGLSDEMILAKSRSLRGVLIPQTLDENLKMVESTGFETSEVFFKWMNWVGIAAIKLKPTDHSQSENNLKKVCDREESA